MFCNQQQQSPRMMIRMNQNSSKRDKDVHIRSVNYRNAALQHLQHQQLTSKHQQHVYTHPIIYNHQSMSFIAAKGYNHQDIQGPAFFYHQHQKFAFGNWSDNLPHGTIVFHYDDLIIFAVYSLGRLKSPLITIIQKHNLAIVYEVSNQHLHIKQKAQVFCHQHIQQLLDKHNYDRKRLYFSLIQFIDGEICGEMGRENQLQPRLRVIDGLYRYGYENGLAIIFDDQYNIHSVGYHNHNKLTKMGMNFPQKQTPTTPSKAISSYIINKQNTLFYKMGQIYSKSQLQDYNIINKTFKDPSQPYFQYLQSHINIATLKDAFRGLIVQRKVFSRGRHEERQQEMRDKLDGNKQTHKKEKVTYINRNNNRQHHHIQDYPVIDQTQKKYTNHDNKVEIMGQYFTLNPQPTITNHQYQPSPPPNNQQTSSKPQSNQQQSLLLYQLSNILTSNHTFENNHQLQSKIQLPRQELSQSIKKRQPQQSKESSRMSKNYNKSVTPQILSSSSNNAHSSTSTFKLKEAPDHQPPPISYGKSSSTSQKQSLPQPANTFYNQILPQSFANYSDIKSSSMNRQNTIKEFIAHSQPTNLPQTPVFKSKKNNGVYLDKGGNTGNYKQSDMSISQKQSGNRPIQRQSGNKPYLRLRVGMETALGIDVPRPYEKISKWKSDRQ